MLRDKNKGFGDIPQQAKIDEFIRSESKRICQFFVSAYALTVLVIKLRYKTSEEILTFLIFTIFKLLGLKNCLY